jgi:hypothetical protein
MSVVFRLKGNVKRDRVREILSAIEEAGLTPRPAFPSAPQKRLASVYLVKGGGEAELERVRDLIESVAPGSLEYIEVPPPRRRLA